MGLLLAGSLCGALCLKGPRQFVASCAVIDIGAWFIFRLASSEPDRKWFQRLITVHGSILLTWSCFELPMLLGLIDYRAVLRPPIPPMHDPQNQLDMELLFRRRARAHLAGKTDGGDFGFMYYTADSEQISFDAQYDENGFRNPIPLPSADIVFIGDSFTEALLVPTKDVVSARLGRAYGATAANYGMMAYGPYQELVVLKRYALPLNPKVVVWLFFEGNDLGDVSYYEWATQDLRALHDRYHGLLHRSITMNAPRTLYHNLRVFKPSGYSRSGLIDTAHQHEQRIYFLHRPKIVDAEIEKALETTHSILAEAHALCREANATLVVGFIPVKYRVYHDWMTFHEQAEPLSWTLSPIPERMQSIVNKISPDLIWVNLLQPLRDATSAGHQPYYRVDSHWNSEGHRVACEALQQAIGRLLLPDQPVR